MLRDDLLCKIRKNYKAYNEKDTHLRNNILEVNIMKEEIRKIIKVLFEKPHKVTKLRILHNGYEEVHWYLDGEYVDGYTLD